MVRTFFFLFTKTLEFCSAFGRACLGGKRSAQRPSLDLSCVVSRGRGLSKRHSRGFDL